MVACAGGAESLVHAYIALVADHTKTVADTQLMGQKGDLRQMDVRLYAQLVLAIGAHPEAHMLMSKVQTEITPVCGGVVLRMLYEHHCRDREAPATIALQEIT